MSEQVGGNEPVARPVLGWSDLAGLSVGVWGLGVEGRASIRRLRQLAVAPVLVDDAPVERTLDGAPVLVASEGGLDALARCDVVVKSPGISRYRADVRELASSGVAVAGGLGLWMQDADRDRVVCVTGTKGKSTTVAIAGHLLTRLGYRCMLGGNIGRAPWDPLAGAGWDFWFVETSSFQATDLAASPSTVAVTALAPDHLDWHGTVAAYYRDKLSACHQPGARLTVACGHDATLRAHAALLGPRIQWVDPDDPDLDRRWVTELGLTGSHNARNVAIAHACLTALDLPEAKDAEALRRAAAGFTGLDSRLHPIGTVDGVEFVDDGLATNVLPTIAALAAFQGRRLALLVGGHDRGIDYGPLATALSSRSAPTLVLAMPASGPRIHAAIDVAASAAGEPAPTRSPYGAARLRPALEVVDCADLPEAVAAAFRWARPDGVVLLSPAAPSFGEFRDYRERAAAFATAMRSCGNGFGGPVAHTPGPGTA